jgi:CheY-like chemotaxis protein
VSPARQHPVLVVEDNDVVRDMIVTMLAEAGIPVVAAADGVSALQHLEALRPSVAIVDLALPHVSGGEFIAACRRMYDHVPIVVCTASHDGELQAERLHADYYLAKPFDVEQLLTLVRRYILVESDRAA